jgi:hypothetical protein
MVARGMAKGLDDSTNILNDAYLFLVSLGHVLE